MSLSWRRICREDSRNGARWTVDLSRVKQAAEAGYDLAGLQDEFGNSLLDYMISCPSSHLLKEDWLQFLETVQILATAGNKCQVCMHMLFGFCEEALPKLSIDKLQIALHAGLRDDFKDEALRHFQHEGRGPFPATLETCLLRRVIREFPREQLLQPSKLQCLEVVKLLLQVNTRTAIDAVRKEIQVIHARLRHLPWLLADYGDWATAPCDSVRNPTSSELLALRILNAQMEMALASGFGGEPGSEIRFLPASGAAMVCTPRGQHGMQGS